MAAAIDRAMGAELGVSAAVVQALAAEYLEPKGLVLWTEQAGNRKKEYAPEGVELLRSLVAAKTGAAGGPQGAAAEVAGNGGGEKKPAANGAVEAEAVMLMIRRICPNPIWLMVETPERVLTPVQVRHSRLLTEGKRVACRQVNGRWMCVDRVHGLLNS